MKTKVDQELIDRSLQKWGPRAQLKMVREEAQELGLAITKFERARGHSPDDVVEKRHQDIIGELADVRIVLEYGERIFGAENIQEQVDKKLARLRKRLGEGRFEDGQ